ncbi:hK97 family phage prohead protease [Ruminococcus sp. CAG:330]|nr:hK97 family phage prohead protease [Ruminococcus sp. CAG:330]
MEFCRRNFMFDIRADTDKENKFYISGRPIVYESKTNLGFCDEVIRSGALDDADLSDVRFLVNHNTNMIPLARFRKGDKNSTMQLQIDNKGLPIRLDLDVENNTEAKALYSAVQRGDISGMSFMFTIDADEWENLDSEHPTRYITKIGQVLEVSAVTFPAYESTEISARDKRALDEARKAISKNSEDAELEKLKLKYLMGV